MELVGELSVASLPGDADGPAYERDAVGRPSREGQGNGAIVVIGRGGRQGFVGELAKRRGIRCLDRAESTATTLAPASFALTMRFAARWMRSASATEVPPNFMTTVPLSMAKPEG